MSINGDTTTEGLEIVQIACSVKKYLKYLCTAMVDTLWFITTCRLMRKTTNATLCTFLKFAVAIILSQQQTAISALLQHTDCADFAEYTRLSLMRNEISNSTQKPTIARWFMRMYPFRRGIVPLIVWSHTFVCRSNSGPTPLLAIYHLSIVALLALLKSAHVMIRSCKSESVSCIVCEQLNYHLIISI